MAECKVKTNKLKCICTYEPCDRKGTCCDCISYHWSRKELPACLFPPQVERLYDRSLKKFIQTWSK